MFTFVLLGTAGGVEYFLPKVCNNRTRGPNVEAKQQAALAYFAHLYVDLHDIQTAFDHWIPGDYIQYHPNAPQGCQPAIDTLIAEYSDSAVTTTNKTVFGDQGFGAIHFKLTRSPTSIFTALDYFRFEGMCIVEYWDVLRQTFGNETNPIAFF